VDRQHEDGRSLLLACMLEHEGDEASPAAFGVGSPYRLQGFVRSAVPFCIPEVLVIQRYRLC